MSIGAVDVRLGTSSRGARRLLLGALGRIKLIVLGRNLCLRVSNCRCVSEICATLDKYRAADLSGQATELSLRCRESRENSELHESHGGQVLREVLTEQWRSPKRGTRNCLNSALLTENPQRRSCL